MGEGVRERIEQVRRRIAEAAGRSGRDPNDVQLVAVTKSVAVSQIREALDAGLKVFGENRVQEAKGKVALLSSPPIQWHLVGTLQTNKSKLAV
ncbi:MAG: yggS, partial [candidate division NC10 bacterium]|nr:yggS [candidate division NC10 bacterium]